MCRFYAGGRRRSPVRGRGRFTSRRRILSARDLENAMRTAVSASLLLALALAIAAASGCATTADDPTADLQNPDVFTRTEANGDVITEYRVAGQLQVVKVTPARGPTS